MSSSKVGGAFQLDMVIPAAKQHPPTPGQAGDAAQATLAGVTDTTSYIHD